MKFLEMKEGSLEVIRVLVLDVQEKMTASKKPYVIFKVTDGDTQEEVKMWNATAEEFGSIKNKVANMFVKVDMYNGAKSYVAQSVRETNDPVSDFIAKVPEDCTMMFQYLYNYPYKNVDVKKLVQYILHKYEEKLMYWSAAKSMHHAIYGGLLYHMYRMVKAAEIYESVYGMDNDILVAGVTLHDIGKLQELETDAKGVADYTMVGRLFGHMYLGMREVEIAGETCKTPEPIVQKLMHIVASHHGKAEWGSIVTPAIKEAEIVHILDLADSRLYQFEEYEKTLEEGQTSEYIRGLTRSIVRFPES